MTNKEIIFSIFKNYIKTVWKYHFSFILFFWAFTSIITIFEPMIFSKIIDQIEQFLKTWVFNKETTIYIIIFWALYIVFTLIIQYIYDYFFINKNVITNYIKQSKKYWWKVIDMEYKEYLSKEQWKLYKILDRWLESEFRFIQIIFTDFLKHISWILAIIIILFTIDYKMALLTLSMIPVMTFLGLFFIKKVSPLQKELNNKWDSVYWKIWNILSWFWLAKTLLLEKKFKKDISKDLDNISIEQLDIDKYWSVSNIYSWMVVMIARIIVIWFWVFFVIKWELTFTNLFIFFAYIWWIYFPLWFLFSRLKEVTEKVIAVWKMYKEFDSMAIDNVNEWKKINKFIWNIEYKDVTFWYSKGSRILNKLSFKINSWEKVAFVWNTWAWKSTIINLLFRFWDIDSWKILLDWENIKKLSKAFIRKNIWIVMQDNSLFNTTIKENLLFANPKASINDIKKALKNAEANFVFDFKDWLDTIIWERWLKLSWGEKQRLAIARLFLKNPKILILDEATSALDNKTEKLVQKALDKLMKGRTSIVIAHRLSTIQNADKIFMLENWTIVESWNYDELMNKKAKFYSLANPEHLIIN